jgi:hypothetical protein
VFAAPSVAVSLCGGAGSQPLISACHLTLRCSGSIKTYQQIALEGPSIAALLATIENLRLVKMRFSAFCAHLNKSYGAKHVMHGGDAETFMVTIFFYP